MTKRQYALSRSEMYDCDRRTIQELGIPSQVLMENAGKACAEIIQKRTTQTDKILIICGDGNNGGDGFVIARWLFHYGLMVEILFTGDTEKMSPETYLNYRLCHKLEIVFKEIFEAPVYDVYIDAVYGIGFKGQLPDKIKTIFIKINQFNTKRFAIDIASGLNADTGEVDIDTFRADFTITMAQAKIGHYLDKGSFVSGEIIVVDIGIPSIIYDKISPQLEIFAERDMYLPLRFKQSHKGTYGRLGIIAGSPSLTGAAILSSISALNCGAGLITLYHQPGLENIFESTLIEVMTKPLLPENSAILNEIISKDTLLIGPGIGKSDWSYNVLKFLLLNYNSVLVIDADAINLLAENPDLLKIVKDRTEYSSLRVIITPHIAEYCRLLQNSIDKKYTVEYLTNQPFNAINDFLKQYKICVLLKNHYCICANQDKTYLITGGNDGLATGGSGDVLAGIIASFLVQNIQILHQNEIYTFLAKDKHDNLDKEDYESIQSLDEVIIKSVSSSIKYLYLTAENLSNFMLTPAIKPSLLAENLFRHKE